AGHPQHEERPHVQDRGTHHDFHEKEERQVADEYTLQIERVRSIHHVASLPAAAARSVSGGCLPSGQAAARLLLAAAPVSRLSHWGAHWAPVPAYERPLLPGCAPGCPAGSRVIPPWPSTIRSTPSLLASHWPTASASTCVRTWRSIEGSPARRTAHDPSSQRITHTFAPAATICEIGRAACRERGAE